MPLNFSDYSILVKSNTIFCLKSRVQRFSVPDDSLPFWVCLCARVCVCAETNDECCHYFRFWSRRRTHQIWMDFVCIYKIHLIIKAGQHSLMCPLCKCQLAAVHRFVNGIIVSLLLAHSVRSSIFYGIKRKSTRKKNTHRTACFFYLNYIHTKNNWSV